MSSRRPSIGITGTFDVENYGDLLFPLVAEMELSRRLGEIELTGFSYHAKTAPPWPYAITPVAELPRALGGLDGLLIGGGHLVRFDKGVADDYLPPSAAIHHPTGFWLGPALSALQAGCPVVWNAVGADSAFPRWSEPLLRQAFGKSQYVAVRDQASKDALTLFAGGNEIAVVPDTCFGVARLVDRERPTAAFIAWQQSVGLSGPYIVVQARLGLEAFCRTVNAHREAFRPYRFVGLEIGPGIGDDIRAISGRLPDLVRLPRWPDPRLMAEIIAHADGVVGVSLHLAITALAFGVPVFRPANETKGKFVPLRDFDRVHSFDLDADTDPLWFTGRLGASATPSVGDDVFARLDEHWDRIAAIFMQSAARAAPPQVGALWFTLPVWLENDANSRKTQINALNKEMAQRDAAVSESNRQLAARDGALTERDRQIRQRDIAIIARERQLGERDDAIAVRDRRIDGLLVELAQIQVLNKEIAERNSVISLCNKQLAARDEAIAERDRQIGQRDSALAGRDQRIDRLLDQLPKIGALNKELAARNETIAETGKQLAARDAAVAFRDRRIEDLLVQMAQIEVLNNAIAERDLQIGQHDAAIASRDRERDAAIALRDGLAGRLAQREAELAAHAAKIEGYRNSTSWRVTAPLRWLARGINGRGSNGRSEESARGVLRFERLRRHALARSPYQWAFANKLFSRRDAPALAASFPRDRFKTVKGYDGEKGFEYESRALIHMGAHDISDAEALSPVWRKLADDLLSPSYRAAMTQISGCDLMTAPMEAYVCHYGPGAWLGPHLDLKDKLLTHVFYFNQDWDSSDGGCLRILKSKNMDDMVAEVPPKVGNSSILVRADNSWHAVSRVVEGCKRSRRSMNVIFYRDGAVSTMWPPGDATPLHVYDWGKDD